MKFRKKPVVLVAATQWFKNGDHPLDGVCPKCGNFMSLHGWLDTLEGDDGAQVVCPGDWIVTGVNGARWPIKPDIFEMTYEKVE